MRFSLYRYFVIARRPKADEAISEIAALAYGSLAMTEKKFVRTDEERERSGQPPPQAG
jgi:hypothetical protein